jgi:DNA-binding response OmpR family regulator
MVFILAAKRNPSLKNILLIEDDKSISDLLEIHLKDMDFNVVKEFNGQKGLNRVFIDNFDLIVLGYYASRAGRS